MSKRELTEKEIQDIIEYYKDHLITDTVNHFKSRNSEIKKILFDNNIQLHTKEENTLIYQRLNIILSEQEIKEIFKYYENHSDNSTIVEFKISFNKLKQLLLDNNIKQHTREENRKFGVIKSEETSLKRYGVRNPFQLKEIYEKGRQTKLEKYGDSNYNNREKAQETCNEIYGVDNAAKSLEVQNKMAQTCNERYGVKSPLNNCECREKGKQTNIEKYGHEVAFCYGSNEFKENMINKYGVDNARKMDDYDEKFESTCNALYGVSHTSKLPENREKARQTNYELHGDPNYNNSEQARQTMVERYGVKHAAQSKELKHKMNTRYKYNNINFDSSWEVALWIYAIDHNEEIEREPCSFEYFFDNEKHYYFPDFKYKDQLIEIKGDQYLNENKELIDLYGMNQSKIKVKFQCMIDNNIIIWNSEDIKFALDYVKEKYGRDYLKQFKNR